jgi:hypothetical protein
LLAAVGSESEFGSFVADFEHEVVLLNLGSSYVWPKRTGDKSGPPAAAGGPYKC